MHLMLLPAQAQSSAGQTLLLGPPTGMLVQGYQRVQLPPLKLRQRRASHLRAQALRRQMWQLRKQRSRPLPCVGTMRTGLLQLENVS